MKNLEPERCPWCGETLPRLPKSLIDVGHIKHLACGKWSRRYWMPFADMLLFICVGVIIIIISWKLDIIFTIGKWFLLLWVLIFAYHYNVRRPWIRALPGEKWWKDQPTEKMLGKVNIKWYAIKDGGIGFPRLRISNRRIFAVCFVDGKGIPVSQTMCVRLQCVIVGIWKSTQVFLISDELWKEDTDGFSPWDKAEKMLIFNKREVIGEGIIRR